MSLQFRFETERDISLLADPEIEIAFGEAKPGIFSMTFVRRRGIANDPDFKYRDPDRA